MSLQVGRVPLLERKERWSGTRFQCAYFGLSGMKEIIEPLETLYFFFGSVKSNK